MQKIEDWLESIDCSGELEAISSDASLRKYYRLKSSMHRGMVMDASLEKASVEPFIEIEHRLHEAGVRVGKIFAYNKKEGFVFLEDLGDTHLIDKIDDDFEFFYNKALDTIINMQTANKEGLPIYDEKFLRHEMELMPEWYLQKHLNRVVDDEERAILDTVFSNILKEVLAQPQGIFVHRDFHSRNIMFGSRDDLVVIDYQDAMVGAITYDLVSLLRDVYVELDEYDVERFALAFRDKKGLDVDDTTFMRWFDFMGLQRHIKILGIFSRLDIRDGKKGYIKDLPLTLKYTLDIASKYPETKALVALLKS